MGKIFSQLLPAIALALCISACGSTKSSEYLSLAQVSEPRGTATDSDHYSSVQLSKSPAVYMLKPTGSHRELFLTIVRECGISDNLPLAAATRQAITGFENLEILAQKPMILGGMQSHYGLFRASLDGSPLLLGVYSMWSQKCLLQINCWQELGSLEPSSPLAPELRDQFEQDIGPLWDYLEPKLGEYFDDQYRGDS